MKTNVAIEINDGERNALANMLDSKVTKRMVTRADVVKLCQQHIAGLIEQANNTHIVKQPVEVSGMTHTHNYGDGVLNDGVNPLTVIDDEDQIILAGKSESYIIGWNRAKTRK